MLKILGLLLGLLFMMCFSLYNWWYQREKYKRLLEQQKKGLNPLNSPAAWAIYSVVSLLAILGVIAYLISDLMGKIIPA